MLSLSPLFVQLNYFLTYFLIFQTYSPKNQTRKLNKLYQTNSAIKKLKSVAFGNKTTPHKLVTGQGEKFTFTNIPIIEDPPKKKVH